MTKNDLINKLGEMMPSKKYAAEAVNKLFECMTAALKDGQKVVITGFGSFNLKVTETKKGRNPKTGDIVMIPPKKKIRFKQSKEIF
jgi:nucleoid DNA-binding protein